MTPADSPKGSSSTSTAPHMEEILVNQSVEGAWVEDGFAIFGVDGNPVEPPIWIPKDRFEALFEKGGEEGAKEIGGLREEGQGEGESG